MSTDHVEVRPGAYADSVTLMQLSRDVRGLPGVAAAQVAMATPLNLDLLAGLGFAVPDAAPDDLVVALRLHTPEALETALVAIEQALTRRGHRGEITGVPLAPRTLRATLARSSADVALVSVPGPHATVEAMDALDAGTDVMVFSDNVPLTEEVALKRIAADRGLLVMGPDCGTAILGGLGLGFANVTRPGPVGVVAASGTGCQQLLCLLAAAGVGVASAIGVGGRDLGAAVRGLSTWTALRRLDADPAVRLIVVVSKRPDPDVEAELATRAAALHTPVQLALLGPDRPDLTSAAESVLEALGVAVPEWPVWPDSAPSRPSGPVVPHRPGWLRGLFVGGTLCEEAMLLATPALGAIRSNVPLRPELALDASLRADGHLMIDFGDDRLTQGRAHPMIDPDLRLAHLDRLGADPATSVLLLDVVLGHAAEPDPAARLAPIVVRALSHGVSVVVALVGTRDDPQGLEQQAGALAAAGAEVHLSNARAALRAVGMVSGDRS